MAAAAAPRSTGVDVASLPAADRARPESDGTAVWDATTMVIVEPRARRARRARLHRTSTPPRRRWCATCSRRRSSGVDAFAIPAAMTAMLRAVRNHGRPGLIACAISAVDIALWDLKARLLDVAAGDAARRGAHRVPVYAQRRVHLVGARRARARARRLRRGRPPPREDQDRPRAGARSSSASRVAREAIGADVELMVDANGAYTRKQALAMAERFAALRRRRTSRSRCRPTISTGLRLLRDRAPAGMAIAAGEYGYDGWYFRRMLDAGAVDILQADATRALGVTGFVAGGRAVRGALDAAVVALRARRSTRTPAAPRASSSTSSTFAITRGWSRCCSTACCRSSTARVASRCPMRPGLGLALRRAEADRLDA